MTKQRKIRIEFMKEMTKRKSKKDEDLLWKCPRKNQFSRSVVSDSLRPHEPQLARPPCPAPTRRVYPNSCPLNRWCHPTISSSVIPFSSCLQSSPTSGFFQMSHFFTSGDQSIGVSASTSDLPMNTQDWSPLGWTGWISLQSKGLSRVFSNITVGDHKLIKSWSKASILWCSAFFIVQLSHPYMTTVVAQRMWNSSAGIPSPLLSLFVIMFPKVQLTSDYRISRSRWVTAS